MKLDCQRSLSMFTLNTVCSSVGYTECLEGGKCSKKAEEEKLDKDIVLPFI